MNDTEICWNCRYFRPVTLSGQGMPPNSGVCHRYPPELYGNPECLGPATHSAVVGVDYCGEWKAKIESQVQPGAMSWTERNTPV